jgi:hypothetical protein
VECIAADGGFISPGIIFEGKQQYEGAWFEVDPKILYVSGLLIDLELTYSSIGLSDNGWTSDFYCFEWFKDVFIPQAEARNTSGKPIILIYNGHGFYETLNLLHIAKEHNIILFSLPPHTTHKLQPLDVGVFGPFACAWIERCDDYMEEYLEEIPRDQFVKHYMDVRQQSFKGTSIRAAFRKSGIGQSTVISLLIQTFAPSNDTSTTARDVPDSYPVHTNDEWPGRQSWSDDDPMPDSDDDERSGNDENSNANDEVRRTYQPADPTPSATSTHPVILASSSPPSSSSNTAAIPPSRFYSKAPKPTRRGQDTEAYFRALKGEIAVLHCQNEELAAHAILAFDQVRNLKH